MAMESFDIYLSQVAASLRKLKEARNELSGLLATHHSLGLSSLQAEDFQEYPVTKAQYDGALLSASDLATTWWVAGHGTNIESFLVDKPS